jgi:hypothetical protein
MGENMSEPEMDLPPINIIPSKFQMFPQNDDKFDFSEMNAAPAKKPVETSKINFSEKKKDPSPDYLRPYNPNSNADPFNLDNYKPKVAVSIVKTKKSEGKTDRSKKSKADDILASLGFEDKSGKKSKHSRKNVLGEDDNLDFLDDKKHKSKKPNYGDLGLGNDKIDNRSQKSKGFNNEDLFSTTKSNKPLTDSKYKFDDRPMLKKKYEREARALSQKSKASNPNQGFYPDLGFGVSPNKPP